MFNKVKDFIASEQGYTAESLAWTTVLGLGAATICFGLYAADRYQGGGIGDDLKAIKTPSQVPTATETVTQVNAGYTGAVTGMTIGQ